MKSLYPYIEIKEYMDYTNRLDQRYTDPDNNLVLHVADFDPLLEAGIDERCVGIAEQ